MFLLTLGNKYVAFYKFLIMLSILLYCSLVSAELEPQKSFGCEMYELICFVVRSLFN